MISVGIFLPLNKPPILFTCYNARIGYDHVNTLVVILHRNLFDKLLAERGCGEFVPRKRIDCTGMPGVLAPELDPSRNFGVDFDL